MASLPIRIGTRGSPLALVQAREVGAAIAAANGLDADAVAIEVIRTTGDRVQDRPLAEIGGKGLFTKEIEVALIEGAIDLAVHSMKDVPTVIPDSLAIAAVLAREDPRDALISRTASRVADLPDRAVVGTSSLRRAALVLALRPDIQVVPFRGNVETRLRKLDEGQADATLLAMAGLNRLGLEDVPATAISIDDMLPAVAQGAIGIEIRTDDAATREMVERLNHGETALAAAAERAFLAELEGSCRTPVAAYAVIDRNGIALRGLIAKPDGSVVHRAERHGAPDDGVRLGTDAAAELKGLGGPDFFAY